MSSSTSVLGTESSVPPWLELPQEITATILHKLGAVEILTTVEKVCPKWRSVCQDVSMWRSIDMGGKSENRCQRYALDKMCRHAVDRSQGQLNDISIHNFGSDELLQYISERSKQLVSLELTYCYLISDKGLIEVAKKLPLLEKLHINYCIHVDTEAIEVIGRYCVHLTSFEYNHYDLYYRSWEIADMEAFAVGQNMHELRHLQLFGSQMTNEGLQAILDGCPRLKSLDLRRCWNVHLSGDLERLCSQRIKDLRLPHDSTDDYDFNYKLSDDETTDYDEDYGYDYDYECYGYESDYDHLYN